VGLVALWFASQPPDAEHPYGHQKLEIMAAGVVGVSLIGMAWDVLTSAIGRLTGRSTELPVLDAMAFVVLIGTLAVNVVVAWWERRRGSALESSFLLSDAIHTRSDVLVTIGVVISVALVRAGYAIFDVIAALVVAAFIAWTGIAVLRQNLSYLVDVALVDPPSIERIVLEVPGVASTHKIRTRGVPGKIYVDLHIQIAPHFDVVRAHRVTHAVIDAIKKGVPGVSDVLVHTEPARPDQPYKPFSPGDDSSALGGHDSGA
jgi:cation diffusion facilitator family transporter